MKRWMRGAMCLMLVLALLAGTALADSYDAIVKANPMKVYVDSGLKNKIGTIKATTIVKVEAVTGSVARINNKGNIGYVKLSDMYTLADISKPAVTVRSAKVYQTPHTFAKTITVKAGYSLNILAKNGNWAMVERDGNVAYMLLTDLSETASAATAAPTYSAWVNVTKMSIYKSSSTASKCLGSLPKGTQVTVISTSGSWAYIELNGSKGYAKVTQLTTKQSSTAAATATPKPSTTSGSTSSASYLTNTSYSVEQRIYMFLTKELGLNTAAACGILASVERECDFRVNCGSYDGGYGIIQWTGSRNTKLKNWCKKNGYDYTTLKGQCYYLKYELVNDYKKIYSYMKSVPNTADGAYDAGHYFCYNFEIPATRSKSSVQRGTIAKTKYWPKYSK